MANANRGLGKGLGALLGDAALRTDTSDNLYLPISQIEPYANQPRRHFDEEALQDLADSIREHGIIQPLTVRRLSSGYYQIIAGERRWRAMGIAGTKEFDAVVCEDWADADAALAMLATDDKKPLDEVERSCKGLRVTNFSISDYDYVENNTQAVSTNLITGTLEIYMCVSDKEADA